MEIKEALEKQIIFDVDIETKESAIEALIKTRIRNDELWAALQEHKRDLKVIKRLAYDIEILIRYEHDIDEIPIITLISEINKLTTKLEKIGE